MYVWNAINSYFKTDINWHWYKWWDLLSNEKKFVDVSSKYSNPIKNPPPAWAIISYGRTNKYINNRWKADTNRKNYWHVEIALWNSEYYYWYKTKHAWWYNDPRVSQLIDAWEIDVKVYLPSKQEKI
jgi:hypothetical protein